MGKKALKIVDPYRTLGEIKKQPPLEQLIEHLDSHNLIWKVIRSSDHHNIWEVGVYGANRTMSACVDSNGSLFIANGTKIVISVNTKQKERLKSIFVRAVKQIEDRYIDSWRGFPQTTE